MVKPETRKPRLNPGSRWFCAISNLKKARRRITFKHIFLTRIWGTFRYCMKLDYVRRNNNSSLFYQFNLQGPNAVWISMWMYLPYWTLNKCKNAHASATGYAVAQKNIMWIEESRNIPVKEGWGWKVGDRAQVPGKEFSNLQWSSSQFLPSQSPICTTFQGNTTRGLENLIYQRLSVVGRPSF